MRIGFAAMVLLVLAGCAQLPPARLNDSPCAVEEATYECQVYRYDHTND